MYCQNCGSKATGNYCSVCGAKLTVAEEIQQGDWRQETNLQNLQKYPAVKRLVQANSQAAAKYISAEEFFKFVDKVYHPVPGISLQTIAEVAVPILQRTGIKTGKQQEKIFQTSLQEAVVKVLCLLAKNSYGFTEFKPASNGAILIATLPSDFWSWQGELIVLIEAGDSQTRIMITTNIKGQLYDWGKSNRIIAKLFDGIQTMTLPE